MTRAEWLQKRDALAALLPSRPLAQDTAVMCIRSLMDMEHGPCPPEEPHVMLDEWRVTYEEKGYIAHRSGGAILYFATAVRATRTIIGDDDDTVRALLALRDRVERVAALAGDGGVP